MITKYGQTGGASSKFKVPKWVAGNNLQHEQPVKIRKLGRAREARAAERKQKRKKKGMTTPTGI